MGEQKNYWPKQKFWMQGPVYWPGPVNLNNNKFRPIILLDQYPKQADWQLFLLPDALAKVRLSRNYEKLAKKGNGRTVERKWQIFAAEYSTTSNSWKRSVQLVFVCGAHSAKFDTFGTRTAMIMVFMLRALCKLDD